MSKQLYTKILLLALLVFLIIVETSFSFLGFEKGISFVLILLLILSSYFTNYSFTSAFALGFSYDLISSTPTFGYFSLTFLISVGVLKLLKSYLPEEILMLSIYLINVVIYCFLFAKLSFLLILWSILFFLTFRILFYLAFKK